MPLRVGRNTKALVSDVSQRAVRHPDAMNSVSNAVGSISKEFAAIIQSKDGTSVTEKEESIKELMEMNQGLLQSMGVSHSSIETVIKTTVKHKLVSKMERGTVMFSKVKNDDKVVTLVECETMLLSLLWNTLRGHSANVCLWL
ncbi:PREDICTED: mevalonate kinase-like [Camelina sativa]|uniref:Mevalonate kinase-like n=1 Tax=Camelina sativa TaxID=90675 RepID=A0ABM1QWX8_CAMSA|nr:PREDICTED: mevalonate kinase-like [Camelina sativa]